jgi:cytochrome c553
VSDRRRFQRARGELRCRACLTKRAAHSHHVTYEAELGRRGLPKYDKANMMALCLDCHFAHHNASRRIPLALLSDANLEYAFNALGAHAFDYLTRRYAGSDPRLDEALRRSEEAA